MLRATTKDRSRVWAGGRAAAARLLAVGLPLALTIPGCFLPRSGSGVAGEFRCESWIVNGDGHRERVSSADTEFDTVLVRNFCPDPDGGGGSVEAMWRRHLDRVLAAGPFRDHDGGAGGWCALSTTCTQTRDFAEGEDPACPDLMGITPLRDDCASGADCILVSPDPLQFGDANLSETAPGQSLAFENVCAESRFLRADETIYEDTFEQFGVISNGCVSTDPVLGRELTPSGTADDGCVVDFEFTPKDTGPQTGEYRTSAADDGTLIATPLLGVGVGTAPRSITGAPRACVDPGAGDCGTVSVGVVSDGPAGFRITATDFELVSGTGFAPPTGPAVGEVFAPAIEARYEVEWCRSRSTLPSERAQLSVTTTTASPGETRVFRVTIDAPAPCP